MCVCVCVCVFVFLMAVSSICLPSRRSVFDMFNFLASKHRQPPEYRPQEDDEDEGQLRSARSVSAYASYIFTVNTICLCAAAKSLYI